LKLGIIRCLKTGLTIFWTSLISGVVLPSKAAIALEPNIKKELALGPAPQSNQSLIKFGALFVLGLVDVTKFTAY